jgi:hypothetical protein
MKIVVIGLVLIVLLLGGFSALTVFNIIPDVLGIGAMLGAQPEAETEAADAPPPAPVNDPEPKFMTFPQMAIPVISDGVARAHLVLALRFHYDPDAGADIRKEERRLTDAYLTELMRQMPGIMKETGRLDLVAAKAILNAVTDRVLGPGKVHDVLIDIAYAR